MECMICMDSACEPLRCEGGCVNRVCSRCQEKLSDNKCVICRQSRVKGFVAPDAVRVQLEKTILEFNRSLYTTDIIAATAKKDPLAGDFVSFIEDYNSCMRKVLDALVDCRSRPDPSTIANIRDDMITKYARIYSEWHSFLSANGKFRRMVERMQRIHYSSLAV